MAFVSPSTVMSYDASRQQSPTVDGHPQSLGLKAAILELTKAHVLPRPALLGALTDAYFKHIHPLYPVVEEDDLNGPEPSVILQQAVCLAGSLALHDPGSVKLCHSQYEKVKTLIYLNFEDDTLALLKTLCLMTCYSVVSTDQVTFDGPWHWLGMAIRLALQMGLHQSSTHERHTNPGCLRRIFWHLVNSDRLAACCWGRPLTLRPQDYDIAPLDTKDFSVIATEPPVLPEALRLSDTIAMIVEINNGQSPLNQDTAAAIVERLYNWLQNLPQGLQLYDSSGKRRPFYRPVCDLHIIYFVIIILLQLADKKARRSCIAASSLTASHCIARLYEEIHCREETARLLQIHGFFCMVAAVPLICSPRQSQEDDLARDEALSIIRQVLGRMKARFGGSDLVLRKISRLEHDMKKENEHGTHGQASTVEEDSMWATFSIRDRLDELFSFPASFCRHVDFSDVEGMNCARQVRTETEGIPEPFPGDDLNFADILIMDYNLLEMPDNEAFGFSTGDLHCT
ncbi:hypothetical protein BHE90_005213 [Fusarium euwallaceae]|uniref:Xylanolytic transcriptional activator regulatory domain-containing protein n=2 Tax=Fusarium solani species complex TaxID=232080 RepID=A0A430LX23_9HYPO|nr:hypothetical protein CDV31_008816 [Fusarium ambrosium]RTE80283.1 hypothetical protein BHE90_005213 [Fusarium euwallaceae]